MGPSLASLIQENTSFRRRIDEVNYIPSELDEDLIFQQEDALTDVAYPDISLVGAMRIAEICNGHGKLSTAP